MVVHLLLLRVRDGLSDAERRELTDTVDSLGMLPGVQHLSWGPDFSGRGQGFTHGAVMHFADRAALDAYQRSEQHRAALAVLDRLLSNKLVVDYETESSGISG